MDNVLTMLIVEGKERRLFPLCKERPISAVPFGGRYFIIDFVLSNFINSGFYKIKVLAQYRSEILIRHLIMDWRLSSILGHHIDLVPPQMKTGSEWYNGSVDAIYQNLNFFQKHRYDHVCIFRSDLIYKMDVRQMYEYHIEKRADLTLAVIPVPIDYAKNFGIVEIDEKNRVIGYEDKPQNPRTIPGLPDMALASMGNYIFDTDVLIKIVTDHSKSDTEQNFGNDVFPEMVNRYNIYAYDFNTNSFPGMTKEERGHWINISSLDSYWRANMGLVSVSPVLNLYNTEWPVRSSLSTLPPAKFVFANEEQGRVGVATDSIVSEGCIISGGNVNRSILFPRVRIGSFSQVSHSILMEGSEIGRYAKVQNAIIGNSVRIPQGMEIGYDLEEDSKNFYVSPSGIVVVTRDAILEDYGQKNNLLYNQYFSEDKLNRIFDVPDQPDNFYHTMDKTKVNY